MKKYFGTDGIRRIANTELTPELVYKVAKAGAYVLAKHSNHAPTILIGRDTRISGTLIESAMTAGFLSYGANVKSLGVMPTPAVAYLTKKTKADTAVVISASHNSFEFNGIKFFSNEGMKISDEIEEEIEKVMDSGKINELNAMHDKIGIVVEGQDLIDEYIALFKKIFKDSIEKNMKEDFVVGLDVANGATYKVAEEVFQKLGINYKIISNEPDGININENCGSTHLEKLKKLVTDNRLSLGIAYDGDGDRCLAVDEKGNEINGDMLLAIFAKYLKEKGKLNKNTIVVTVMSNLGLNKFAEANDLDLKQTKVGDRYVLEEMLKNGYNLGGEQSGHVIMLDYNPTGDGILTSLMLIQILLEKNMKASEVYNLVEIYPQVLLNAKVSSDKKNTYENDEEIKNLIEEIKNENSNDGRVLIRPSGTEPLVRVMIEAKDKDKITNQAKRLVDLIERKSN